MENRSPQEIKLLLASDEASDRILALKLVGKFLHYSLAQLSIEYLKDPDDEVREFAALAMDQLSCVEAVPDLVESLFDSSFNVRTNAGWALINISRKTLPNVVVPDVIEVLQDAADRNARQMAYLVLHHIGGESARDAIQRYWWRRKG
jgi:HEAT repeat protein